MNAPTPSFAPALAPRARGVAMVATKQRAGRTVIDALRQQGSLKIVFPRSQGPMLDGVLVNTAGGVTGGDSFDLRACVGASGALTLTTQAAERAYRAQPAQTGRITNTLIAAQGAKLAWLPQETILFQGSALHRTTRIDLAADAKLLFCEPLVFGRAAMGETVTDAMLHDHVDIYRDGQIAFKDALRMTGDIHAHLAHPATANGAGAIASIVYIAPDAAAHLAPVRAMLPDSAGASLIADDLLFVRLLAPDSFDLRTHLIPILTRLNGTALPRPWMI